MVQVVASLVFWAFLVVSSLLVFPVLLLAWALEAPFGRKRPLLHRLSTVWACLYTWFNPWWPVTVHGRERIDPGQTHVLVANHQSLVDILALYRLHTYFSWVSKAENFRVPVIGWAMRLNAHLPVVRGDRESAARLMAQAEADLRAGITLAVFPEGTRSRDGRLRPFKTGAFELAVRTGLPVLPVVVRGTGAALPRRGFVLRGRHPISVQVLEPVHPAPGEEPAELCERVRSLFAAHVPA